MASYLLIESRDPFESNDVGYYYELARGLAKAGNKVTVFLTQNAVLAARPSAQAPTFRALIGSGVRVEADDFSLKERGVTKVLDGVKGRANRYRDRLYGSRSQDNLALGDRHGPENLYRRADGSAL